MPIQDSCCELWKQEVESFVHLFVTCPIARPLRYTCCWGLKPEEHQLATPVSIIKLVLEPPKAYCPNEDVWLISLQIAFILDEIRYVRNQSFDQGIHMNGRCLSLLVFYSFNKDWSLYIYIYILPSPYLLMALAWFATTNICISLLIDQWYQIMLQIYTTTTTTTCFRSTFYNFICSIRPLPCFWEGT